MKFKADIEPNTQQDIHASSALECRQTCNEDNECMAYMYDDDLSKCVYTRNLNPTFTSGTHIWHVTLCGNHGIMTLPTCI